MEMIRYKGVLCRIGTYRVKGEDKPALYYVDAPDDQTVYNAGFEDLHYGGPWVKILTDEEYKEIWETAERTRKQEQDTSRLL